MNDGIFNQLSKGEQVLQWATGFECPNCLDSRLDAQARPCFDCHFTLYAHERACEQLAAGVILREERGLSLEADFNCARALVRVSAARPVRNATLGLFLGVDEREVKQLVKTLRDEWHLPIGSLRVPPYGYYWISTPAEFLAWFEPMRSQAMSELRTAWRLMKRHYPELAGQFTFNFEEAANNEEQA